MVPNGVTHQAGAGAEDFARYFLGGRVVEVLGFGWRGFGLSRGLSGWGLEVCDLGLPAAERLKVDSESRAPRYLRRWLFFLLSRNLNLKP